MNIYSDQYLYLLLLIVYLSTVYRVAVDELYRLDTSAFDIFYLGSHHVQHVASTPPPSASSS